MMMMIDDNNDNSFDSPSHTRISWILLHICGFDCTTRRRKHLSKIVSKMSASDDASAYWRSIWRTTAHSERERATQTHVVLTNSFSRWTTIARSQISNAPFPSTWHSLSPVYFIFFVSSIYFFSISIFSFHLDGSWTFFQFAATLFASLIVLSFSMCTLVSLPTQNIADEFREWKWISARFVRRLPLKLFHSAMCCGIVEMHFGTQYNKPYTTYRERSRPLEAKVWITADATKTVCIYAQNVWAMSVLSSCLVCVLSSNGISILDTDTFRSELRASLMNFLRQKLAIGRRRFCSNYSGKHFPNILCQTEKARWIEARVASTLCLFMCWGFRFVCVCVCLYELMACCNRFF